MEELTKQQAHYIFKIHQKAHKCIKDYELIQDGDKLLIGLSGGKDSLALVEILGEKMKVFHPKFSVIAAHISVENIPYKADLNYLNDYCRQFNIPFIHASISFDSSTDHRKSPCFLCSWNRRKKLFEIAKTNACNKIALGHHQDDILETLLMNMCFQGAIGTMPPSLKMNKFDMTIIRPLSLHTEQEIIELAAIRKFPQQSKNCPFEKDSNRTAIKNILQQLEKLNPRAKNSLWGSMTNIQSEYLPKDIRTKEKE